MPAEHQERRDPIDIDRCLTQVGSMLRHENDLMNHRLTWMWTLQGLLFAAYAVLLEQHERVTMLIAVVGLVSSVSIGLSLVASHRMLQRLNPHARQLIGDLEQASKVSPVEFPTRPPFPRFLYPWLLLPWFMALIWVVMLVYPLLSKEP